MASTNGDEYDDGRDDREWDDRAGRPAFPGVVMAAGVIWIGIGLLALGNAALTLWMAAEANANPPAAAAPGLQPTAGGAVCGGLVGIAFLACGIQTVRGTATDTRGNGIGSIAFGLLQIVVAVGLGLIGMAAINKAGNNGPADDEALAGLIGVVVVTAGSGLALVTAGILGLVGRNAYRDWRAATQRDR